MMSRKKLILNFIFLILFPSFLIVGCVAESSTIELEPPQTITKVSPTTPLKTPTVSSDNQLLTESLTFWVDPLIFEQSNLQNWERIKNNLNQEKDNADYWIEISSTSSEFNQLLKETYFILSVPFISSLNNVAFSDLQNVWIGRSEKYKNVMLWVNQDDIEQLTLIINHKPTENVIISDSEPETCNFNQCWRINKFESADPKWRIISIDNQSLLNHEFDPEKYPLVEKIFLRKNPDKDFEVDLPFKFSSTSNFNPSHLTSLLITGTTALVRNTAYQIEENGLEFPLVNIQGVLDSVDLIHVSNEVPFYSKCPPAVPVRKEMRFCSDPEYIEILKLMGVDIVELTGNHLLDWGPEAFLETLSIYRENDIQTYAGGETYEIASIPLIIKNNGNKLAFLGCNLPGPENDWVSDERPGSLPCNIDELEDRVREVRDQGYIPIFTFQHYEFDYFQANNLLKQDFWRIAKAGAVIVSGSQAHFPQGIDFVGSSFIHYGLGNFLFDQMYSYWGKATIDVHYFYENQYINTVLFPIKNENYGQPRIMTDEEAMMFLGTVYNNSFYYKDAN